MNIYLMRSWTHHEPKRPRSEPGLRQAGFKPPPGQAAVMLHLGNIPVTEDVTAAWFDERLKEARSLFENEDEGLGVEEVCAECGQEAPAPSCMKKHTVDGGPESAA